ncbi:hypothetical protein, partial [Klebsiella pneumoniae]|uniref:hypothetical protein n=1 Tax=Klebsiella pneumoniae TaxID=573 RepID=UPI003F7AA706
RNAGQPCRPVARLCITLPSDRRVQKNLTTTYSCTDRMTVVDVRKKKSKVVPYKELERYSIERKNSPLK